MGKRLCGVLLSLFVLFAVQEPGALVETIELPDGSVETCEYVLGDGDAHVRHGEYKRVFADGSTVAEEGAYRNGARVGKWRTYFASGRKQSEGSYRGGLKSRAWKYFFDSEGKPVRAKGSYEKGQRSGKWSFFHEFGLENSQDSGTYRLFDDWYLEDRIRGRGELLLREGSSSWEKHGAWQFSWPSGQTMIEATFVNDELAGDRRFYHCDGTYDPKFFAATPDAVGSSSEGTPSLAALDRLLPPADPTLAQAMDRAVETAAETLDPVLMEQTSALVGQALRRLIELDLTAADEVRESKSLVRVIRALAGGRSFEESESMEAPSALSLHRWFSLWWLTRDDLFFWRLQLQAPLELVPNAALYSPGLSSTPSTERERVVSSPVLSSALEWLARHQSRDGSWSCSAFRESCGTATEPAARVCAGAGYPEHDIGVTGLALLAFLRAGHTWSRGDHRNTVADGLLWLASKSDSDGLIAERSAMEFIYNHAIATTALAEASTSGNGGAALRGTLEKAVDVIYEARDPLAAWRYDLPSLQNSDVSMTGWMLGALRAAERAGIEIDRVAVLGGLTFIKSMADPESYRIGYLATGSGSARIPGVNAQYAVDRAEPMTAIGMLALAVHENDLTEKGELDNYAELLMRSMPKWEPKEQANDMYYWRAASEALYQAREHSSKSKKRWKTWSKAMVKTATESQRQDGDAMGSWDPIGPWGMIGGRVYSTAIMTLALIATEQ